MGLFNGFYTSLTGLNGNSHTINVTGNNIANVNTTAFKAGRAEFETQISNQLRSGSAPNGEFGGTNPTQVGLGVRLSAVTHDFGDGSLALTGVNTDLAIEGNGFFVVNDNGEQRYTRAGNMQRNSDSLLVTAGGAVVQGYGIDGDFNIVDGVLADISIPIGALTLAEATTQVTFSGNLDASGDTATQGARITSSALFTDALATVPATALSPLAGLFDGSGLQVFSAGDVINVTDATRGGATVPDKTFEIGAANTTASDDFGTTVQDYMDFLEDILGIDTTVGGGVTIDLAGQIVVDGNSGTLNDLGLVDNGVYVNTPIGITPFTFTQNLNADGESVRTTFVVFDSLGEAQTVDLTIVLEGKSNLGTTWRFYAQSEDDSDLSTVLGSGTISFDTNGQVLAVTGDDVTLDRAGTGADTPQNITMQFDDPNLGLSALADNISQVSAVGQDGSAIGTLDDFTVQNDGLVVGEFSNGLQRSLGRIVLATFVNPQGLVDISGNLFDDTPASGTAAIVTPGTGSAGRIIGQALELSNVDITEEFISLVAASTGFSANSRVFSTSDRLLQELLATIR